MPVVGRGGSGKVGGRDPGGFVGSGGAATLQETKIRAIKQKEINFSITMVGVFS